MELIWTRRYSFQSVHSLDSGALRERRHGHRYFLEISFSGRDIDSVDDVVEREILPALHGRELATMNPSTGENIVNWIHDRLQQNPMSVRLKAVALQETRKNRFVSAQSEAKYV